MPWNWAAGDGRQNALGTECDCNRQRGKYGCRISVVSGRIPLLLRRKKKKTSIGGPWKSVVKANIQHPCRDFCAIIFIGRSTGAIESVAWKMVWCLGGDGEEGDAYPSPIAGDRELHFCIHGQRDISCCSAVAEGGGMLSCFLCQIIISVHMWNLGIALKAQELS